MIIRALSRPFEGKEGKGERLDGWRPNLASAVEHSKKWPNARFLPPRSTEDGLDGSPRSSGTKQAKDVGEKAYATLPATPEVRHVTSRAFAMERGLGPSGGQKIELRQDAVAMPIRMAKSWKRRRACPAGKRAVAPNRSEVRIGQCCESDPRVAVHPKSITAGTTMFTPQRASL